MVLRIPKFLGGIDADMSNVWAYEANTLSIVGSVSSNAISTANLTANTITINNKTVLYDGMDLGGI